MPISPIRRTPSWPNLCLKISSLISSVRTKDIASGSPGGTNRPQKWSTTSSGIPPNLVQDVDQVLAPSHFVEKSFLENGFPAEKIHRIPYSTDLSVFRPDSSRPPGRPFTLINTGGLSLRKGTPYLLEALRNLKGRIPDLRILLTRQISDSIRPILSKYGIFRSTGARPFRLLHWPIDFVVLIYLFSHPWKRVWPERLWRLWPAGCR